MLKRNDSKCCSEFFLNPCGGRRGREAVGEGKFESRESDAAIETADETVGMSNMHSPRERERERVDVIETCHHGYIYICRCHGNGFFDSRETTTN
jgi:hypothetical protein